MNEEILEKIRNLSKKTVYPLIITKPPFWKSVIAKLTPIYLYTDLEMFERPTKIYLSYCKKHRIYYLDYLHGHNNYTICPLCLAEVKEKNAK